MERVSPARSSLFIPSKNTSTIAIPILRQAKNGYWYIWHDRNGRDSLEDQRQDPRATAVRSEENRNSANRTYR